MGLSTLDGEKAFYYKHDNRGRLVGIIYSCMDDFNLAWTKDFIENVTMNIEKTLDISKIEDNEFRFTG